jgi:hypothetical protein
MRVWSVVIPANMKKMSVDFAFLLLLKSVQESHGMEYSMRSTPTSKQELGGPTEFFAVKRTPTEHDPKNVQYDYRGVQLNLKAVHMKPLKPC